MDLGSIINGIKKVVSSAAKPIKDAGGDVPQDVTNWASSPSGEIDWSPSGWTPKQETSPRENAQRLVENMTRQQQANLAAAPKTMETPIEKAPEIQKASGLNPVTSWAMDQDVSKNGAGVPTDETNKKYDDLFAGEGYDKNADQNDWFGHLAKFVGGANLESAGQDVRPEDKETFDEVWDPYVDQGQDDGSLNANNLTSNWMTGAQYRKYVNAGIPGLSPDEIKDDQMYNKRIEQLENGFVPYVPDDGAYWKMAAQNTLGAGSRVATDVRNARANNAYGITLDGKQMSSDDFDRDKAADWYTGVNDAWSENPVYKLNDGSGLEYRPAENPIATDDNGKYIVTANDDDTFRLWFDDGTYWDFDGEGYEDTETDPAAWNEMVSVIHALDDPDSGIWTPSYENEEYEMGNGDKLSYGQVKRLIQDTTAKDAGGGGFKSDEGISYDFGPLNWNKPQEAMENGILTDENGAINLSEFVPQLADMALSSAQYVNPYIGLLTAASDAYVASRKMDPTSTGKNGELKSMGYLDDDTKQAIEDAGYDVDDYQKAYDDSIKEKVAGNMLMPWMEYGLGGIGHKIPGLGKWVDKSLKNIPGAKTLVDIAGEGAEEIPGNITEEWAQNGSGRFAFNDYLRDKDGNIVTDSNGNPLRELSPDGSFLMFNPDGTINKDKHAAFWGDAPESFEGGAALGAAYKLLEGIPKLPGAVRKARNRGKDDVDIFDPSYEWDYKDLEKEN